MKLFILITCLLLSAKTFSMNAKAIGIILGSPTGLSGNIVLNETNSLDGAISFGEGNKFSLHSTYLFQQNEIFNIQDQSVIWYYGAGARIKTDKKTQLGARVALGIKTFFPEQRVEIFGESAGVLNVTPSTDFDLNLALGGRYYF